MRLIGYIRVSTDEQDIGHAVQEHAIKAFCELYGHELTATVGDIGVSGGTPLEKRAGGRDLLKLLRAGEADGVITHQLDRLFRSIVDGVKTCDDFNQAGFELLTVHDKIDTSHPDGWAALAFRLVASEWERRKIGWRTTNAMTAKREAGECYGHPQYGLLAAGEVPEGRKYGNRLFRDPATWPVRERIVAAYRSGTAPTLRKLQAWVHEQRIAAPGGGRRWGLNTLSRLVKSHDDFAAYPFASATDETAVSA